MKAAKLITFTVALGLWAQVGMAQKAFNSCAAAFLGNKMVVDEYTTTGKCILTTTDTGDLTVSTVDLSPTESKAVDPIWFQVAIRDGNTKTLTMVSKEKVKKTNIRPILEKCKKGDYIVLLTISDEYALPHNEILVQ
jgi:hypothetical protein